MIDKHKFLAPQVGKNGAKVGNKRNEVVRNRLKPKTISELWSFTGLLQFIRRFLQKFSIAAASLTNLTRKGCSMSQWNANYSANFFQRKEKH